MPQGKGGSSKRGFAAMSDEKQREIASKGGKASGGGNQGRGASSGGGPSGSGGGNTGSRGGNR